MVSGQLIESIATTAYQRGADPLDVSQVIIEVVIEETLGLPDRDPRAVLLGRRVVACLLEVGWQFPGSQEEP